VRVLTAKKGSAERAIRVLLKLWGKINHLSQGSDEGERTEAVGWLILTNAVQYQPAQESVERAMKRPKIRLFGPCRPTTA